MIGVRAAVHVEARDIPRARLFGGRWPKAESQLHVATTRPLSRIGAAATRHAR